MKVYAGMAQVESLIVDIDLYKWFWFVHQPNNIKPSLSCGHYINNSSLVNLPALFQGKNVNRSLTLGSTTKPHIRSQPQPEV
jgi:hypothetical protein